MSLSWFFNKEEYQYMTYISRTSCERLRDAYLSLKNTQLHIKKPSQFTKPSRHQQTTTLYTSKNAQLGNYTITCPWTLLITSKIQIPIPTSLICSSICESMWHMSLNSWFLAVNCNNVSTSELGPLNHQQEYIITQVSDCLLYTSPSPRD